jgi:starch synthase
MTGLIPLYQKTAYKKEPVFSHSKVIYTIGNSNLKDKLAPDFLKMASISSVVKEKDLEPYKDGTTTALMRGGATYADAVTFGADKVDKKLVDEFGKVKGKKVLTYNAESDLTDYLQLYSDLAK